MIKNSKNYVNNTYDEAYLTYIPFNNGDYYIEHNDKFSEKEISELHEMLKQHFK